MLNPVTDQVEPHYSSAKRLWRYLESVLICVPILCFVFAFLVACYNITGVILPESKHDAFLIPALADLAKEGAIFDAESNMAWVTTIGQVVLTLILNMAFREVAIWLTERENHKY